MNPQRKRSDLEESVKSFLKSRVIAMGTRIVNFTFKYRLVYLLKVLKVRWASSTEPL